MSISISWPHSVAIRQTMDVIAGLHSISINFTRSPLAPSSETTVQLVLCSGGDPFELSGN